MMRDILFWNAGSIRAHDRIPTLEKLCDSHPFLAIALSETKLDSKNPLRVRNYHCVGVPERSKNAGGVCVLVHRSVEYAHRKELTFPQGP